MNDLPFLLQAALLFLFIFVISFGLFKLRLPSILGYLLAGTLLGLWLSPGEGLGKLAEVGLVMLFFLIGLDFPIRRLLSMIRQSLAGGLIDLLLNFCVTLAVVLLFRLSMVEAFLVAAICYTTSSSVVIRLLDDTRRLANPESEVVIGVLIIEDLAAPLLIALLTGIVAGGPLSALSLATLALKLVLFIGLAIFLAATVFRSLSNFFTANQGEEFIDLFLVSVALGFAGLAVYSGLSEVLGAFLAGLMLAETETGEQLEPLVLPLRNLTLPLFFLVSAAEIDLPGTIPFPLMFAVLLVWSVMGKILTGYLAGRAYQLSPRASWRAGFSLVPRAEFSLVVIGLITGPLKAWGGAYILATALLGIISFLAAPRLAKGVLALSASITRLSPRK